MPAPHHRLAICKRCRWPERIASGADSDEVLQRAAEAWRASQGMELHVRRSQCLNCCDAGHTVRVETPRHEVAIVGIRTVAELHRLLEDVEAIGRLEIPPRWQKRAYQVWVDGRLVRHAQLDDAPTHRGKGEA